MYGTLEKDGTAHDVVLQMAKATLFPVDARGQHRGLCGELPSPCMDTSLAILLCVIVVGTALAYFRRQALRPAWAWNDVGLQLVVGGRQTEIFIAEVSGVEVNQGHLVFETRRGFVPIASRWVTPPFIGALAIACGLHETDVQLALKSSSPVSLWRGEAGAFGLPNMS